MKTAYGLPMDACPECGDPKLTKAKRCKPCANKARRGESRTDTPSNSAGWYRARQIRPVAPCEYGSGCDKDGTDRHHLDANPKNNDPTNIAVLCRYHHMLVDGRIDDLRARAGDAGKLGGRPRKEAA